MDSEARYPDSAARLRLVDLMIDGEHLLHFGGGFTCVLADNGTRGPAAHAIASAIIGPRPSGSSGAIDIDGRLVSVWSLPSPLLPRDAPAVIDRDLVQALWRVTCARRRGELAAAHAACSLDGRRIEAERERLGVRTAVGPQVPPRAPVASPAWEPSDDRDAEVERFMDKVRAYGRVESVLAVLEPEPSAEASRLAERIDALAALVRQRRELGDAVGADVDAAERRVKLARIEVAMASGAVGARERAEIESRHRAVVEAEAQLSGAGRRKGQRAAARYDAAVAAEQAALADAGIDSYAMFLLALTGGETRSDERARRAAQEELTDATRALEEARRVRDLPSMRELEAREQQLRDRAGSLLGRQPGPRPSAELRALRVDPPDRPQRLRELAAALRDAGVDGGDDAVGAARRLLASPPSINIPQQPEWPMPGPRSSERLEQTPAPPAPVDLARAEALEHERSAQQARLAELEAEMRGLEAVRDAGLADLSPRHLTQALESTLSAYRAGDVLGGRVPLVLDGVLDHIAADACEAAVGALSRALDLQVIVVSNDPQVMQRIRSSGGAVVRWPEPQGMRDDAARGVSRFRG